MISNFLFLQKQWPDFFQCARETEELALNVPRSSAFSARYTLEQVVNWLYNHDDYLKRPYRDDLAALIHEDSFRDNLAPGLFTSVRFIWKTGNDAAHKSSQLKRFDRQLAVICLHHLFQILSWFYKSYGENPSFEKQTFDEKLLPDYKRPEFTLEEKQRLETELAKTIDLWKKEVKENKANQIRFQRYKEQNKHKVAALDFHPDKATEDETRKYLVDIYLAEAGWALDNPKDREFEVKGMPTETGLGYVDYVLWGENGLPLAVVEAKRTTLEAENGKHQARLYADCLEKEYGQRPLIFYTNGYDINFWDDKNYPPRPVLGFYSKDELSVLINRRETIKKLTGLKPDADIAGRYYQIQAVTQCCETLQKKRRKALLVMATGTGKTRTAISLLEILLRGHWVKRALFLADRNALLRQAKKHFQANLPTVASVDITREKEDINTRLVFSTYPTMMNMINGERDVEKQFGVGHFDLIFIDEVHRSVYAKYKTIFEYFDSLLVGLTATPKDEMDKNTFELFDLENGVPTFAYTKDEAVKDDFLVDYKSESVPMKFQSEGIKYDDLTEEEKLEYEEKFYDDDSDSLPQWIDPGKLNTWVFNKDTVDKVLMLLMEKGQKVQGGDRLGKTIIFAKNHKHADFITQRFNLLYPHLKGSYLQIIDNQVNHAQNLIDKFYLKDEHPIIAVSVDMMDTGIDVPEILNLVFFKVVRSKSKFHQMIGRGTRKCPDLFAPGEDKKYFSIFDFCANFEFFGINDKGHTSPQAMSLSSKIFLRRLEISRILTSGQYQEDKHYLDYYKYLIHLLCCEVKEIKDDQGGSIIARAHRRYLDKFSLPQTWINLTNKDLDDINLHIAPLCTPKDDDELARRFDLLVLNLQIAMLQEEKVEIKYVKNIKEIAFYLYDKKMTIPSVAKNGEMLKQLINDDHWKNIAPPYLEEVRTSLRGLVKFIEKRTRNPVYTDFEDTILDIAASPDITLTPDDFRNYKLKMEKYIREHKDYLVIQKLRMNEKITSYDLEQLEHFLFENEIGDEEDFKHAFPEEKSLGVFIRSIVGLDRGAAKQAFAQYLDANQFNTDQISFINQIIDFLTSEGKLDPAQLFQVPFDRTHAHGISGLFDEKITDAIIDIVSKINNNAEAG